MTIDDYIEQD